MEVSDFNMNTFIYSANNLKNFTAFLHGQTNKNILIFVSKFYNIFFSLRKIKTITKLRQTITYYSLLIINNF